MDNSRNTMDKDMDSNLNETGVNMPLTNNTSDYEADREPFQPNIPAQKPNDFNSYQSSEASTTIRRQSPNYLCGLISDKTVFILLLIAMITSAISLIVAVLAAVSYADIASELEFARKNREQICLPCDVGMVQNKRWKRNSNGECCAKLDEVIVALHAIAKTEAEKEVRAKCDSIETQCRQYGNGSTEQKQYAQFVLSESHLESSGNAIVKTWKNNNDVRSFMMGEVFQFNSNEGKIQIKHTGHFFIYSQITAVWEDTDRDSAVIEHEICFSHDYRETIALRSTPTKWKPENERHTKSQVSQLFGVVYLSAGSDVYVKFSEKILANNEENNYFGLIKL